MAEVTCATRNVFLYGTSPLTAQRFTAFAQVKGTFWLNLHSSRISTAVISASAVACFGHTDKKVKLSRYRPGQALGVPGG